MTVKKLAITKFDDIDRHGQGCGCGNCDSITGRCFGVGIFESAGRDEESLEQAIWSDEPVERVYACSPHSARENAKTRLEELGYEFLADI